MLTKLWEWSKGKKTYAIAALLFVVYGAEGMGWLPKEQADWLKGLLAAGGLAALRASK